MYYRNSRLTFQRLGMDGHAVDLREMLFDAIFKSGRHIMNGCDRQVALHGAVTRSQDPMFDLADANVVAIYELVVFSGQRIEKRFDIARELLHLADAGVGRGDVAAERLDMNINVDRAAAAQLADAVFELGRFAMSVAEAEIFIDL